MSEPPTHPAERHNGAHANGISARKLAERATVCAESPLSERALERWLVDGRLAERRGDLLYATPRGRELAGGLD